VLEHGAAGPAGPVRLPLAHELDQDPRRQRAGEVEPARGARAYDGREVVRADPGPLRQPGRLAVERLEQVPPRLGGDGAESAELQDRRADVGVVGGGAQLVEQSPQLARARRWGVRDAHVGGDFDREHQRARILARPRLGVDEEGWRAGRSEPDPHERCRRVRAEPRRREGVAVLPRPEESRQIAAAQLGERLAHLEAAERVEERAVGAIRGDEDALREGS
jgi:hypothetical protein